MRGIWKLFAFVLVLSIAYATQAQAANYVATAVPQGTQLRNNNGVLVTWSVTQSNTPNQTTLVSVVKDGITLAAYMSPPGMNDSPRAINDANVVVGDRLQTIGPNAGNTHATLFSSLTRTLTDLHPAVATAFGFDAAATRSIAVDINDAGEVIGMIWTSTRGYPFHYKDGVVTDLISVTGAPIEMVRDINNFGQMTGMLRSPHDRAFIYQLGGTLRVLPHPGENIRAEGLKINDAGQVAGTLSNTELPSHVRTFVHSGGVTKDLGFFEDVTIPMGMNNSGLVVGTSNYGFGVDYGFYSFDPGLLPFLPFVDAASLNGRKVTGAFGVNDDGAVLALADGAPVLLKPDPALPIDPAIFNFETTTQGWLTNGEVRVGLFNSTNQAYAGERSLSIATSDAGFGSVRVVNPSVQPGHTLTFRVYLSADAKFDWVQPFAQGGADDNWAWFGQWTPVGGLRLGAWNTLTVHVPSNAHSVHAIGLEFFSSQPNPGRIYLDSVDYGATLDETQYNFETGTQNWRSEDDPSNPKVIVATSAAEKFAGRKSLALQIRNIGLARVSVDYPSAQAGDTITFHVFIPSGVSADWIQPFVIEGAAGNWAWHGNLQPINGLQAGAWNTITVDVPASAQSIAALGIELSVSQASASTIYVDSVSY